MNYAGLGVAGAAISLVNGFYYVFTILRGQTRPQRISWFGWSLIGIMGAWSAFDGGAGAGALVAATGAAIIVAIFFISLLPGRGKPGGRKFDYVVSGIAIATIIVWRVGHFSPWLAATIAVLGDIWFAWLTVRESWYQPETEALGPWIISGFSDGLGVLAIKNFNYSAAVFPAYLFISTVIIAGVLFTRKRKVVRKKPSSKRSAKP